MSSLNVSITGRKDGFAINLQMGKFVANGQICCKFNIQICINFAVVVLLCLRHKICNTYTHAFTHTQIYGIKFATDFQWLFYYLYYAKFAIHTLIPLHIRKFIGSNLHQICNGCFIIFTI